MLCKGALSLCMVEKAGAHDTGTNQYILHVHLYSRYFHLIALTFLYGGEGREHHGGVEEVQFDK